MTKFDLSILAELEDENARRGDFKRLWPSEEFKDHFPLQMSNFYADKLCYHWTLQSDDDQVRIQLLRGVLDGKIVLVSEPQAPLKKKPNILRSISGSSTKTLVNV